MMRTTIVVERAQLVARTREDGRHVYRKEDKAALVAACTALGALVAAIALAHGVNANLLRKWITRSHMRDRAYPDQRTGASAVGDAAARSAESMNTNVAEFLAVALAPARAVPAPALNLGGGFGMRRRHLSLGAISLPALATPHARPPGHPRG